MPDPSGIPIAITVAPSSGVPIYRQLMEQVRLGIAGGRLAKGEFLPSVRQVAEQLAINPMTVSKAYTLMERDGIIELVRGQGMRVCAPGAATNGKARRAALLPLLQQVAHTAHQLSIPPDRVLADLKLLLEESDD
jgi:GntR family transcriptional regulator